MAVQMGAHHTSARAVVLHAVDPSLRTDAAPRPPEIGWAGAKVLTANDPRGRLPHRMTLTSAAEIQCRY